MRSARPLLFSMLMLGMTVPGMASQPTPQVYSARMLQTEMMTGRPANFQILRDEARELVIMIIAPSPDMPKGMNKRVLFDFKGHRMYTRNEIDKTCNWIRYTSARAPLYYDPISGSYPALAEFAGQTPKLERKETVNGFVTTLRVYPDGKGLIRLWVADESDVVVQMQAVDPNGKITNKFAITKLTYEKPAPGFLTLPMNCTETQGEASETGMVAHVEMKGPDINVSADTQFSAATSPKQQPKVLPSSAKQAITPAAELPLGTWAFKGKDNKGILWSGDLAIAKSAPSDFEDYICTLHMQSSEPEKKMKVPCAYDPAKRSLTMISPSGSYSYAATVDAEGKNLVRGKWTEKNFGEVSSGVWSAKLTE